MRIVSLSGGVPFPYPFRPIEGDFLKEVHIKKNIPGKEKLLETQKGGEKERLFDLLIHDLTGPLSIAFTSTVNLLHKADRYGPLSESQKQVLERVQRNIQKARNLLQEMVEILRSEEGFFQKDFFLIEKTLQDSLFDALEMSMPHAVEKLCLIQNREEFQGGLKEYGIYVEIKGKYCNSPFCHDQKKIRQILRNLMGNALKYRKERMEIRISGDTDMIVLIEDDGMGIPLADQEAIFKRFVRLNDDQHAHVPGLGLGLTGVKTLVEAMGGEITLESREGMGTRFTVRIPPI